MMGKQVLFIDDWRVPKLINYDVAYNKLWGSDTGRDMAGENKGTLVGIFPKLQVEIGSLNKDEMKQFLQKANKAELTISWYDVEIDGIRSAQSYYINDYTISLKNTKTMKYKAFSFNLIPNKKR